MMAIILLAQPLGFAADPAVVPTEQGYVRGVVTSKTRMWRGIPFAEPPVGSDRWQSPRPAKPWTPAVLDATQFGHNCLQSGHSVDMGWPQPRSTLSEDCLTLNVYSGPAGASPAPVLFWIYGGGFQGGGGNETRLNGTWDTALMRGELVVVTSNYRLGAFGFAASSALAARETALAGEARGSGNYGLLDQRAAMKWTQANIAAFGGDPSRVFIVGQSAGAFSVSEHLVRPASWGLFAAAGMESGAFYAGMECPTLASSDPKWKAYVAAAGCAHATDPTECVVALPADAILNLTDRGWGNEPWDSPVIDGIDLVAPGPTLAAEGKVAPVPILIGGVEEDISAFDDSPHYPCTRDDFVKVARDYGFTEAEADALAGQYATDPLRPGRDPDQLWCDRIHHAGADAWSNCPARRLADWYRVKQQPAWWYKWSYVPNGPNGAQGGHLAHHSVEQPFIFHVLAETDEERKEDKGMYFIDPTEVHFSERIVRAWAAMAASGNPNARDASSVGWLPFNSSTHGSALLIGGGAGSPGTFNATNNFLQAKCDLFDAVFSERMRGQRGPLRVVKPWMTTESERRD